MTLSVTQIGNNFQQPGISAEAFIPDQLIAGIFPIVTDSATITGGAVLQRGSVLGKMAYGAMSASAGTAFASGTITLASQPSSGDTVTIGGTVVTFVTQNPIGNQVIIGANAAATAQSLAAFLIGSFDTNLVKFAYTVAGTVITLKSVAAGTGGNSLTLATSNATAFTLSGATLAGGVANTGNATVGTISAGKNLKPGAYSAICVTATTANVFDPLGNLMGITTFGTQFTDSQISFMITAGGTPCVANDRFSLIAATDTGRFKLANAFATDGSQIPVAILADYIDASVGDFTGPIYLQGEFTATALTFGPGITLAAAKSALAQLGIFIKTSGNAFDPN